VGLAEDAGVAAAWLSAAGFAGAEIAYRAIENIRKGKARPVIVSSHSESLCPDTKGKLASVMYAAPSIFDFLQTTSPVTVVRLDEPLLLFGHLVCSSSIPAVELVLHSVGSTGEVLQGVIQRGHGRLEGPPLSNQEAKNGSEVSVTMVGISEDRNFKPTKKEIDVRRVAIQRGVAVNEAIWTELKRLAAQTLVPESVESKQRGAGAGLIDND
ncbi:uncharacterized protein METZ01_LOCUS65317, partial [marine metagenome]